MSMIVAKIVAGLAIVWAAGVTLAAAETPRSPKLIHHGWGNPDTTTIARSWPLVAAMPFDGTGIDIAVDREAWASGERSTENKLGWRLMGPRAFRFEDFSDAVRELCSAPPGALAESFLDVALASSASDPMPDWFDEDRWRTITASFGMLSRIAAECGLRGLILDPEHYDRPLFRYAPRSGRSFAETTAAVRRRGREVTTAIAASHSRPVLLFLFGYTLPLRNLEEASSLEKAEYGLLAAFLDGVLEALPPGGRLVDGYEFAYGLRAEEEFAAARRSIREARRLAADPRRYDERVEVGFGLWLDFERRLERYPPGVWKRTVDRALDASDGYVWVYTQKVRFFPPTPDAPPYVEAMRMVRRERGLEALGTPAAP